ncbi:MAG: nucleotidyltransferase family protein [Ignavibacteriaceae bacterium]
MLTFYRKKSERVITYTIIYEKVSDTSFPKGYFYTHIPSLDLTTHGLEIEGAKKAAEDLLKIMSLTKLKKYKKDILKIASLHGAKNIKVFGSVARGEQNQNSDIDFVVEMEKGKTVLNRIALMQDLKKLLGQEVDVVTYKSLREKIKHDIIKDAVEL